MRVLVKPESLICCVTGIPGGEPFRVRDGVRLLYGITCREGFRNSYIDQARHRQYLLHFARQVRRHDLLLLSSA